MATSYKHDMRHGLNHMCRLIIEPDMLMANYFSSADDIHMNMEES